MERSEEEAGSATRPTARAAERADERTGPAQPRRRRPKSVLQLAEHGRRATIGVASRNDEPRGVLGSKAPRAGRRPSCCPSATTRGSAPAPARRRSGQTPSRRPPCDPASASSGAPSSHGRRLPPQELRSVEQEPVEHQEERRRLRRREDAAELVLEQQSERARPGSWRRTSSDPSLASVSSAAISRSRRLRPIPLTIRTQSRPEETPSRTSAVREMRRDDEDDEEVVVSA